MKQYDITDPNKLLEYEEGYSQGFKAGMLAAADIVIEGYPNGLSEYAESRHDAAEIIRGEANGNTNNS